MKHHRTAHLPLSRPASSATRSPDPPLPPADLKNEDFQLTVVTNAKSEKMNASDIDGHGDDDEDDGGGGEREDRDASQSAGHSGGGSRSSSGSGSSYSGSDRPDRSDRHRGDYGAKFRAGGLGQKRKPKAKKMKRGGLASKK